MSLAVDSARRLRLAVNSAVRPHVPYYTGHTADAQVGEETEPPTDIATDTATDSEVWE